MQAPVSKYRVSDPECDIFDSKGVLDTRMEGAYGGFCSRNLEG